MYNFLKRLTCYFKPHFFLKEEIELETDGDKSNLDSFSVSGTRNSIEKTLRNRIRERKNNALYFVKKGEVMQAAVFVSQIEELEDIMREWSNRKQDIERRNKQNEA